MERQEKLCNSAHFANLTSVGMSNTPAGGPDQRDEFLAKAEDAERRAAASIDSIQKASWENIAASYRELAGRAGRRG